MGTLARVTSSDDTDALTETRGPLASSHGVEGDALVVEVRAALETLTRLLDHGQRLGSAMVESIRKAVTDAEARLARSELRVVVVGEPGSGKSTLLDALIGERVFGKSRVMVPVTLRSGPERDYRARFAGGALDHFAKSLPDRSGPLRQELAHVEAAILEANQNQPDMLRELSAAGGALELAEDALDEITRELETIRAEAEDSGRDRLMLTSEHTALRSEAEQAERALPALFRKRPAWWAIWLWPLWLLVVPFLWGRMRRRRTMNRELERSTRELSSVNEANDAAEKPKSGVRSSSALTPKPKPPSRARELDLQSPVSVRPSTRRA
jgi:hypothetical protein